MSFMNLRGGQRVQFWMRSGMSHGVVNYVKKSAKVQPLLTFHDHVVVNLGGRFGTPYVVDADNFIKVVGKPVPESAADRVAEFHNKFIDGRSA